MFLKLWARGNELIGFPFSTNGVRIRSKCQNAFFRILFVIKKESFRQKNGKRLISNYKYFVRHHHNRIVLYLVPVLTSKSQIARFTPQPIPTNTTQNWEPNRKAPVGYRSTILFLWQDGQLVKATPEMPVDSTNRTDKTKHRRCAVHYFSLF